MQNTENAQPCKAGFTRPLKTLIVVLLGMTLFTSVTILAGSQRTAQAQDELNTTMMLFDLSGSMGEIEPDGRTRLATAQQAMIEAIGGVAPGSQNIGLRSFSDCGETRLESAPAPVNQASLAATINSFVPDAQTDIATALNAVAGDFVGTSGRSSVILLSDGLHNCSGDPCVAAANLIAAGVDIVVHAIGIGTAGTAAEAELACIAQVTGGTTISVAGADELLDAISAVVTGGPTSAVVKTVVATCITSPLVQNDASLGALSVGTPFTDSFGVERILVTGEDCNFGCAGGFDMNCDGIRGDFCPSEFDRNTVAGAGKCLAALKASVSVGAVPITLEELCDNPAAQLDSSQVEACEHFAMAQKFQLRADNAWDAGDAFLAGFNQTLADDQIARANAKAGL